MSPDSHVREEIGRRYIGALYEQTATWLQSLPGDAPIDIHFSGGIDSGAAFLTTYRATLDTRLSLPRLKAFTLSVDGGGEDLAQSRRFLESLDLQLFHEVIHVPVTGQSTGYKLKGISVHRPLAF